MTSISLKKLGSNSAGFSPDPSKVTLLRFSTLIPPPITMAPHDGGLPLTLSYALADNDPALPSLPRKHTAQILRERCLWGSWGRTKWEATQTQSVAKVRENWLQGVAPCVSTKGQQSIPCQNGITLWHRIIIWYLRGFGQRWCTPPSFLPTVQVPNQ